jgi:hypothetical protein
MTLNKTAIALEIVVLLGILVAVEWLAHVLTDTRNMFVPAVLTWGIYIVLRVAISARNTRRARKTPTSDPLAANRGR